MRGMVDVAFGKRLAGLVFMAGRTKLVISLAKVSLSFHFLALCHCLFFPFFLEPSRFRSRDTITCNYATHIQLL